MENPPSLSRRRPTANGTRFAPLDTAAWPETVAVEDLAQAEITLDLTACFGTLSPGRCRLTLSGLSAEFDLD